jgi:UDP-3-O-[3-hydroxymyristoyl] N-acetylglucosamine deacetylase
VHWPSDYFTAYTLASEVEISGVGLHSGAISHVRLQPSDSPGYWVGWLNRPQQGLVRLHPSQVCESRLCTVLKLGQDRLATVEHLLAALAGMGIRQAQILVEGPEIPLLDGSALPWVELAVAAGLRPCPEPHVAPTLRHPCTVYAGGGLVTAVPAEHVHLGAAIEFEQMAIGCQVYSLALSPRSFVEEIAPARTFCLRNQVDQLRQAGLIKGGCLDNALVCDGDHWLNPPLRFAQEPVRHKILDLLGDLALVGLPCAQVFAYRGSHRLHTALAAALVDENVSLHA